VATVPLVLQHPTMHAAMEELRVCTQASAALLNRKSTFSERIRLLRWNAGADEDDSWW
jgi:hypothetical protein